MKNCSMCEENGKVLRNDFDVVGKVFYKTSDETLMCYRHWYQQGRPKYKIKGNYHVVMETHKPRSKK